MRATSSLQTERDAAGLRSMPHLDRKQSHDRDQRLFGAVLFVGPNSIVSLGCLGTQTDGDPCRLAQQLPDSRGPLTRDMAFAIIRFARLVARWA